MLKKLIPIPVGLTAIVIAVLFFTIPVENNDTTIVEGETKSGGLLPPADNLYEVTQLSVIDINSPNPPENVGDLGPDEPIPQPTTDEPNKVFVKYNKVREVAGYKNIQMLSNDDNSRITIFLSNEEITSKTTNHEFVYRDQGIWISIGLITTNIPADYFTGEYLNDGYRVVKVNDKYNAALESMGTVEFYGETQDIKLSLEMVTETHAISFHGFISDEKAIKIADYLSRR